MSIRRPRPNSRFIKKIKIKLIEKSKAENNGKIICNICKKEKEPNQLVCDHIDNNPQNNAENNFQLIDRRCNYQKNPPFLFKLKGEPLDHVCVRMRMYGEKLKVSSAEFAKGEVSKPLFVKWLYSEMLKFGKMAMSDVVYSGSEVCGVGPVTVREFYLKPKCSRVGDFEATREVIDGIETRVIIWKPGRREKYLKSTMKQKIKKFSE